MKTEAIPAAPTNGPDPRPDRPGGSAAPSRSAGLLRLVRGLIAFGEALIRTLQASPTAEALSEITSRFGTHNLTLIIARITRGLMLAANLDARLVRYARQLDTGAARPTAIRTGARRKPHTPIQPITQQADDAALLSRLPTAEEIAAQLRGKSIGLVLEDICRDFGITCDHPLWRELHQAILYYGGRFDRVLESMSLRVRTGYAALPNVVPVMMPNLQTASFQPTGTGPP